MAKLYLLALAAAAALVFITAADASRFTVTTLIEEGGSSSSSNPDRRGDCGQQIQRQDFRGCDRYMSDGNRRDLNRCCQELDRLPDRCEREALRDIMRRQQGHHEAEGREEMMQRAREIESTCRLGRHSEGEVEEEEEEMNPSGSCREQVQREEFRGCEQFVRSGDRRDMSRCCRDLERVDERCQREAMREIMRHQGGGGYGMREMEERAREALRSCGRGGGYGSLIGMVM